MHKHNFRCQLLAISNIYFHCTYTQSKPNRPKFHTFNGKIKIFIILLKRLAVDRIDTQFVDLERVELSSYGFSFDYQQRLIVGCYGIEP